jgi:polysaccharide export outer membrane protein
MDRAKEHYDKGNAYYEKGDYTSAYDEFRKSADIVDRVSTNRPIESEKKPFLNKLLNIPTKTWQEQKIDEAFGAAEKKYYPEYIVCEGDILALSVWQNPDLDQDAIVRPDGRISVPLVGDILVAGKTISQIDDDVTSRLKDFIKYPEVSVYIRQMGGGKVMVLGEVKYPGVYFVTGRKSVMEAVTLAGGFTSDSLASTILVVKAASADKLKVVRVSANMVFAGSRVNNIMLESEDIVFVPKKPISDMNWFILNVIDPILRQKADWKTAVNYK